MITRRNLLAAAPAAILVPAPAIAAATVEPSLEQQIEAQARLLADLVRQAMPAEAGRFSITVNASDAGWFNVRATGFKTVWAAESRLKAGGLWIEEEVKLPLDLTTSDA